MLADLDGAWHAVSMLGANANWVRNLQAAGARAVIRHGSSWPVRLTRIEPDRAAAILRRYLKVAPGARPHFPIEVSAPLHRFADIAAAFPAFGVDGYPPPRERG